MSGQQQGNPMEITANAVKELREKTGVGMMECKKALQEAAGDPGEAEKILRKRGMASAAKKADRAAGEGSVASQIAPDGSSGVLVEVNCETDFAARNDDFQALVREAATLALKKRPADLAALLEEPAEGGKTLAQLVHERVARIGENIVVRRFARFDAAAPGTVAAYVHTGGKIGVLLEITGGTGEEVARLARDIAMHVAAASPRFARREEVTEKDLDLEREIARDQAAKSGKPAAVVEKIVAGKMEKYYAENCLLEQPFVKDPDRTVGQVVQETGKKAGAPLTLTRFVRFVLGESLSV
jgi:elongation factor Ts